MKYTTRQILRNQYRILRQLENSTEYDDIISALESGITSYYRDDTIALDEISDEIQSHTVDVMIMYDTLIANDPAIEFPGFCGHDQTDNMAVVTYIVKHNNGWDESIFLDGTYCKDSHGLTLDTYYHNKLNRFNEVKEKHRDLPLNYALDAIDIQYILHGN